MKLFLEKTLIPWVSQSLRLQPHIRTRRPLVGTNIEPCCVLEGFDVTGGFTCRLTNRLVPNLLGLVFGLWSKEEHVYQTYHLFTQEMTPLREGKSQFSLILERDLIQSIFYNLEIRSFALWANRYGAIYFRLNVKKGARRTKEIRESDDQCQKERFYFFEERGVCLDEEEVLDCAGFRLTGNYEFNGGDEKRFVLKVRRKERLGFDYRGMREKRRAQLHFTCPDEYEKDQRGRFFINLGLNYKGEIPFRDEFGTWGWEFSYYAFDVSAQVFYK